RAVINTPSPPMTYPRSTRAFVRRESIVGSRILRLLSCVALAAACAAPLVAPSPAGAAAGDRYRRWISPKTKTCSTTATGVQVAIDNQDVEFNNLPADAQFTIEYIVNGVSTVDGPFTVEQTSGTKNYGSFSQSAPSYPFTFTFRLNTIIGGDTVYRSD